VIVILALAPHSEHGDRARVLHLEQNNISRRAKWHDQFAQERAVFVRLCNVDSARYSRFFFFGA